MKLKSSEPFWLVKNGLLASYPSLREDKKVDILIVGGGITGSLIAHQCMEDGFETMLIDKREVANGSTSATTAMLQYEIDTPLYKLIRQIGEKGAVESYWACYKAIDTLGNIARQVTSDSGFKKKDSLYFAAFKKDVPGLIREFDARKAHGLPVEWLPAADILKRYRTDHTQGGILSHQGGSMDAFRFTHDVLAYNSNRGLAIYDKTDIEKVKYNNHGVQVLTQYGNIISARRIIYCNGYESVQLIKDNFVRLLSTYAIVGECFEGDQSELKDLLIWNTADPYIYMRTTDDNRILIGGGDEPFLDTTRRDALLDQKRIYLEKQLLKLLPADDFRRDFRTDFVWAGTFGETKDGLPYIGKHPDFPAAYFVLGFGGNGITFSVMGMEMVSCMLKGKKHPLEPYFSFRR